MAPSFNGKGTPVKYNLQMFDSQSKVIAVYSEGYESIICHCHDFAEITYILSGTAIHFVSGGEVPLKKGDIFAITAGQEHSIRPTCDEKEFRIINLAFDYGEFDADYTKLSAKSVYKIEDAESLFLQIDKEYQEKQQYFTQVIHGLVQTVIARLLREADAQRTNAQLEKLKINNSYIRKAVEYIQRNYQSDISLDSVAKHVGICTGYLQKLFREERRMTVYKSLILYRIEQSCRMLLETDASVANICDSIGYGDIKNFHSAFKKIMGMTPDQYRHDKKVKI